MTFNNIFLGMCIAPLLLTVSTADRTNRDEFYNSALTKMIESLNWENQPPVVRGDFASEGMKIFLVNVTNFNENQFVISELHEVFNITSEKIISARSQKTPVDHKKGKGQSKTKIQLDSTSNKQEEMLQLLVNYSNFMFKPSSKGAPDKIYPKIVIYLHPSYQKHFNGSYFDMEAYILTLLNGVDLNFRTMDSPKIRLSISAIVLLGLDSLTKLDNEVLLMFFAKYANDYSKEFGINSDIDIVIIGNKTLIPGIFFEGRVTPCAACEKYNSTIKDLQFTSLIMFFDDTTFSGISILTQYLAQLFCSQIIRFKDPTGEGTESCPSIHDMTSKPNKSKHYLFSACEQESMSAFLSTEQAECLRNKPSDEKRSIFERILPGANTSLTKQCRNAGFDLSTRYCILGECLSRNKTDDTQTETTPTSGSKSDNSNNKLFFFSFFFSTIGLSRDYKNYFALIIFWMVKEYLFLYY